MERHGGAREVSDRRGGARPRSDRCGIGSFSLVGIYRLEADQDAGPGGVAPQQLVLFVALNPSLDSKLQRGLKQGLINFSQIYRVVYLQETTPLFAIVGDMQNTVQGPKIHKS